MQLSNKKHIEELKQAEERYEKKIADLRKSAQEELLKAQESMAAQKKKELLAL